MHAFKIDVMTYIDIYFNTLAVLISVDMQIYSCR